MDTARSFDPRAYGPVMAELLSEERLPPLGPGKPDATVGDKLAALTVDGAFAHAKVADPAMAQACISALWLYHDYLDESHRISQQIDGATGSYWHGIMHRREPDFGNAKYWFRKVGSHGVFPALADASRGLARAAGRLSDAAWLADSPKWDAFAFIDTCEAVLSVPGPDHELCRRVGLVEWQLLFDHSYRHATAAGSA